jgi:tetratricopeptide (TPR) repeat protein
MEGLARMTENDFAGSLAAFSKSVVLERNPHFRSHALVTRGFFRSQTGDKNGALADYSDAIAADPNYSFGYQLRADLWLEQKEYDRAIADCTEEIRLTDSDQDTSNSFRHRGQVWFAKKDYAKAIADFDEAIRLNPKHAEAFINRGIAYAIQGQHDRALADYDAALRLDPKHALALYARGAAKLESGNSAGNADIAAAMAIDPDIARKFEDFTGR